MSLSNEKRETKPTGNAPRNRLLAQETQQQWAQEK